MTLPYQRTNAVINTRQFLFDVINPSSTPGVPKMVREKARSLLKHFPTELDMEEASDKEPTRIIFAKDLDNL